MALGAAFFALATLGAIAAGAVALGLRWLPAPALWRFLWGSWLLALWISVGAGIAIMLMTGAHARARDLEQNLARAQTLATEARLSSSATAGARSQGLPSGAGLLAIADEGTIFLDEIGDLSPQGQAMLLRVLEDKEVRPLGADESIQVESREFPWRRRLAEMLDIGTYVSQRFRSQSSRGASTQEDGGVKPWIDGVFGRLPRSATFCCCQPCF